MGAEAKEERPCPHLCVNVNVFGGAKKLHASLLDWVFLKIDHMLSLLTIMIIKITSIY